MLWWQGAEYAVENELCQKQFVPSTDFTGDPAFHVNDVRGTGETQTTENPFPALEFFHLQDIVCRLDPLLEVSYPRLMILFL